MNIPRLLVAGTHSGVGKTTLVMGLMRALRRRGLRVAPFKVGPDYLDPGFHAAACGRSSTCLDTWMLGVEGVRSSFARGCRDADIAIVEGMMGLHDGASSTDRGGSSAEVAGLLQLPTLLVLDGGGMARSAGAVALGFRAFDARVPLVGVAANRVSGEGHAAYLRPALEREAGLPLLGWLPPRANLAVPERHLGLVLPLEREGLDALADRLACEVEAHFDLDRLLALARNAPPLSLPPLPPAGPRAVTARIAVAQDAAFCFYYPDNLRLLEEAGAELVPFSPLRESLPPGVGGVYLGGGYPELYAAELAANEPLRRNLRGRAESGGPVLAECGGFMYLCEELIDLEGKAFPMAGLLLGRCVMEPRLQAIGYREVALVRDTPLGRRGEVARGHEFRHSRYEGGADAEAPAFQAGDARLGIACGSVVASYVHLHFASAPAWPRRWVESCALAPRYAP